MTDSTQQQSVKPTVASLTALVEKLEQRVADLEAGKKPIIEKSKPQPPNPPMSDLLESNKAADGAVRKESQIMAAGNIKKLTAELP